MAKYKRKRQPVGREKEGELALDRDADYLIHTYGPDTSDKYRQRQYVTKWSCALFTTRA